MTSRSVMTTLTIGGRGAEGGPATKVPSPSRMPFSQWRSSSSTNTCAKLPCLVFVERAAEPIAFHSTASRFNIEDESLALIRGGVGVAVTLQNVDLTSRVQLPHASPQRQKFDRRVVLNRETASSNLT